MKVSSDMFDQVNCPETSDAMQSCYVTIADHKALPPSTYLHNLEWSTGFWWQAPAIHLTLILATSSRADQQRLMVVVMNAAGLKGDLHLLLQPIGACWTCCHCCGLALKCSRALPSERCLVISLLCEPMVEAEHLNRSYQGQDHDDPS